MANIKVGGEVDAYCTKCKMPLAHTILAIWAEQIKRVRCNTCMGEHAYRSPAAEKSSSSSSTPSTKPARKKAAATKPSVEKASVSLAAYESLVAGKDRSTARRYAPAERFAKGDLVEHPAFGLGVVAAVRGDKVDLAFREGVKTLQHLKGAGPALLARPPAPKRRDVAIVESESQPDPMAETSEEPELASTPG